MRHLIGAVLGSLLLASAADAQQVSDFSCVVPQTIPSAGTPPGGTPLLFELGPSGINLATGVLTAGTQFNAFVFSRGVYQLELFGFGIQEPGRPHPTAGLTVQLATFGPEPGAFTGHAVWHSAVDPTLDLEIIPSSSLISVLNDNTVLTFNVTSLPPGGIALSRTASGGGGGGKGGSRLEAEPEVGCYLLIIQFGLPD